MRITHIRPVLLQARFERGAELRWVGGRIESWDIALIEIETDTGFTGLGEVAQGIMAAQAVPGIVSALRPYLDGVEFSDSAQVGAHLRDHTAFWARGGIAAGVIGATETAALDAAAKSAGLPAWAVLGPSGQDSIELYASGGLGETFADVMSWVNTQLADGLDTVKFRAMKDPETTIDLMRTVAAQLPDGKQFVLDAVQGCASRPWQLKDAMAVGQVAESLGARWYEEPCRAEQIADFAYLRTRLGVAISGVESYANVEDFDHLIRAGGVDIVQPDVSMVGGPTAFRRVAAAAADAGLGCVPHVWGSGVTMMANLHVAFSLPSVTLFEYCTLPNPLRRELLSQPLQVNGSRVMRPTAPGLGVELTADIEDRYRYDPNGGGHVIA
jgi:D-galactarolactone cycloisomerase